MAYVINDDCISCGACAAGCPVEAISEGAATGHDRPYSVLITKSTLMFVLIVVLVLEHVQLALLTHSSLNKIQINVHQMVFNVPERYLHKTPDQFNTDSGFFLHVQLLS